VNNYPWPTTDCYLANELDALRRFEQLKEILMSGSSEAPLGDIRNYGLALAELNLEIVERRQRIVRIATRPNTPAYPEDL
jgi:hypothetical protein